MKHHLDRTSPRPRRLLRTVIVGSCAAIVVVILSVLAWFAFPLPEDILHPGPGGSLVLDREGRPLLSIVAVDEQHRLPLDLDEMGSIIPAAVIAVEDHSFRSHPGIDAGAILGAIRDNVAAGRVVRGASTITMQVAGMKLGHPRTIVGKSIEAFRALQIESVHDKDEILETWLNLAPFGGNLVGIEAASRGWFGKAARDCSIAEAALLVGLPNAPERFRPDRHPEASIKRRSVVLDRMLTAGLIEPDQHRRAMASPVRIRRRDRSENTLHAGWMAIDASGRGRVLETTIDPDLQEITESIVDRHASSLPDHLDISIVLVDHVASEVVALVGSSDPLDPGDGAVNGATSRRSPGSALKPFIYGLAFETERLSPSSIVDDTSADFDGWRPRNIDRRMLGPIEAGEALRSSRNLPAILLARDLGAAEVVATLRRCGLQLPPGTTDRVGLSIAVGGVETRPIDLAEAYATLARGGVHRDLRLIRESTSGTTAGRRVFSERTCAALEACLAGPITDVSDALPFIASKTGTSSGHRDALAAGWNRRWTAVVWVGRFDGGGDPSLLGSATALPILEDLLYHPRLATARSPRPFRAWTVAAERAAGRVDAQTGPRILHPKADAVLVGDDRGLEMVPEIRAGTRARLFLNGRPVSRDGIRLNPGSHELRIVEPGLAPHAVTFTVVRGLDDVGRRISRSTAGSTQARSARPVRSSDRPSMR